MESTPKTVTELTALADAIRQELGALAGTSAAEAFRIKYLGKKGMLRSVLKALGDMPEQQRRSFGAAANKLHEEIEAAFSAGPWNKNKTAVKENNFDFTLPAFPLGNGSVHPLTKIRNEIRDIFVSMGFTIAYGPEVETDYNNFEALNMPPLHPARDMQDTFYITPNILLRTHTSPVQIRVMQNQKPPIRSIMPGRAYRNEAISSRAYCMFHQCEGLYIDKNVSFADLKGTLLAFAKRFFDENTKIKIRPSFFPFTEPSVEVDVQCFLCKGTGCSLCKQSGWLEILGAGMVHPHVLVNCRIDPEIYTGFAFGMGLERVAMLKYGINDIRLFFENDVRFLEQF
jgi:phenylalanyl-tRNA synthetase alpha chain